MKKGISVCMILYNDGEIVKKALDSVKRIANEILIVHDGPCNNETLKICKKYTKNIFIRSHKGLCEYHQAFLYRKAKFNWILKLDSDEFLSKKLEKNIRKLIKNPEADAYSFIWLYWDGKKYITKNWPRKTNLYRKNKISYLAFANWGEPDILGNTIETNYKLEHRPPRGDPTNWETFFKRDIKLVLFKQAKDAIKPFKTFDKFQYNKKDFPNKLKIRIRYPLLSIIPLAIVISTRNLLNLELFKNPKIILKTSLFLLIRSAYYGYYIYKLQKNPNWKN